MKTLLFYPKLEPEKSYHYFPVSLLAAAAPMTGDIKLIDERIDDSFTDEISKASHLMISAYTGYQVSQAYAVSKWVKDTYPHIHITWGGPHASTLPEQTLASGVVDEVVIGDVDTGQFPLPYHLIDIEKYINPETKRFIYVTSYGCPGQCSFCATKKKRPFKLLPTDRIAQDISCLMSKYRWKEVVFFDATLFTKLDRVESIIRMMMHYKLQWIADARAVEIAKVNDSFLKLCVNSGLKQLTIGLESGSPRVVDIMKKGRNHLENFKISAEKLAKFPLKMVSGVVFGTPGETVDDLRQTIDFIKRIKEINSNFYISSTFYKPLPCTEMTDICIKEYGYKQPDTLQGWAELGEKSHYNYNTWENVPWIRQQEKYQVIYESFKARNSELFV